MTRLKVRVSEHSNIKVYLTIFISKVIFTTFVASSRIYASYGDDCNLSRLCDQSRHLACINGVCQCESPSNQRYDNSSGKCLSVVGGPCTPVSTTTVERMKACIGNAQCVDVMDESGESYTECQCLEGFIENSGGECVPGIGKPCSYQPNECNPLGMVVCKNGVCNCVDELQFYDPDMKRCVSPAGTHCKYDSLQLGCVKNAICYPFFYWIPPKCLCKPGYIQTKSRHCIPENEYHRQNINIAYSHYRQNREPSWPVIQTNQTVQI
ncbi:unnamed protein product [Orchesella dallaii]|uniref:EB domain-containing protein n=1 Tax=Orchesella dallaii TaxID=48710 RepID=A0ABP1S312_9HEXA